MQVTLNIPEKSTMGMCPACKEWTDAGDSCCGRGAWVEGSLVTDEEANEHQQDPTIGVRIVCDAPRELASAVHSALFKAKVSSNMWAVGNSDKWNVTLHLPVSFLVKQ